MIPGFVLQFVRWLLNAFNQGFTSVKTTFVYRSFWGRGNLHKQILHVSFASLTGLIVITGLSVQISRENTVEGFLSSDEEVIGNIDLLEQGGSIQTVLVSANAAGFQIFVHKVKEGETLDDLVSQYGVTKRTILDSNRDSVDFYEETVKVGATLYIPEVSGVLLKPEDGDTVKSLVAKTEGGDIYDVLELNAVSNIDDVVASSTRILVPNATLPAPPKPLPQYTVIAAPSYNGNAWQPNYDVSVLNGISFSNPLINPECAGYSWSRGFTPWHQAVDLAKGGGCSISAVAPGVVTYAGWGSGGQGYYIVISHGNGVESLYYHGDGNIWVSAGQSVGAGQPIMHMGCTGWCTGTHLHLELRINGNKIDPAPYVPY